MKGFDQTRCILEVSNRFPRISGDGMAFPFDKVVEVLARKFRIKNFFDFVFLFRIYDNGRWYRE